MSKGDAAALKSIITARVAELKDALGIWIDAHVGPAVGFVRMEEDAKRRVPTAVVQKLHVEIDPFSLNDRLEIA